MSALITTGFHHITLITADAGRATAFYRDLLGMRLLSEGVDAEDPSRFEAVFGDASGAPGTLIRVVEAPDIDRGRYGTGGVHHFALGTATRETLLKWKRRLTDAGVSVSGPMPRGYFTSLYFTDPDRQVVEIATAGPGYAIDESIEALGQGVMAQPTSQLLGTRDDAAIAAETHSEPVPVITTDMALTGLHHISGITDDIARASDFYEEALGLRLIKKTVNQDAPDTAHWFWANYDGTRVLEHSSWTLFGWTPRQPRARLGVGQSRAVAFRAADELALQGWGDHLRSLGLEVSAVADHGHHHAIRFTAPDGQPLAIATDAPGLMPLHDPHHPHHPQDPQSHTAHSPTL